jgi:hypothetical protein
VFGLNHSEFHTGYYAFCREVLETVNFIMNSHGFIFDQEIIRASRASGLPHGGDPGPNALLPRSLFSEFLAKRGIWSENLASAMQVPIALLGNRSQPAVRKSPGPVQQGAKAT